MSIKTFRSLFILFLVLLLSFVGFTPALAAPPTNDNFAGAETISSPNFTTTVDITEAGTEPGEPQPCNPVFQTVWYTFAPTEDMVLRADIEGSTIDGFLAIYRADGPGFANLFPWACTGTGYAPAVFPLQAGNVYHIQAGSAFEEPGMLQINLELVIQPANDNFAQAAEITTLPFHATVDNGAATMETEEPQQCSGIYKTVWYSFVPSETMLVMADVEGSTLSANINIYRATGPGFTGLQSVTCTRFFDGVFLAEAGERYYLQAGGQDPTSGDLQINLTQLFPPPNDNFADAELITSLPFSSTVQINGATVEPGEPSGCNNFQKTAWYKFTPASTITVHVDTLQSTTFTNVHVYQQVGSTLADLNLLGCVFSGGFFEFTAEAGQTYYLQAGGTGSIRFDMREIFPPPNDNFANAQEVTTFPFNATVDISEAIDELNEPQNCHFMDRTVWYTFLPTATTRIRADTQGSFINGNVSVYQANGLGFPDLQFLQCSGSSGFAAFTAEAGQLYYFQLGAAFDETGNVQLNLTEAQSIMGRVTEAETGAPLPGNGEPLAYVTLLRVCGDGCLEGINSQYADGEGRFVFDSSYSGEPISAGLYEINIIANQYQSRQFGPFELNVTTLDVGDIPLNRPPGFRGRVVDTGTGNPISAASITLRRCDNGSCFEFVNSQTTGEDGLFNFTSSLFGDPLPDGTYEIEVAAALYETRRVEVVISNGAHTDIGDVTLALLSFIGSISGRLVDAATGKPVSEAFAPSVQLYRCTDGNCSEPVSSQIPDAQGQFRFETDFSGNPLPAGTYQLLAFADQYEQAQTDPFEVGEGMHVTIGNLRIISFPVRFSDIQPCTDIPASGGECSYSVKVWNGLATKLRGGAWSVVNGVLPDAFAGITDFQVRDPQEVDLEKGRSKTFRFRFNVSGNNSTSDSFLCARLFVGQGNNSLWNTVGFRELFCVSRTIDGFAIASPQEALAPVQADVTVAATGTDVEPNNSCQTAQDVGAVPLPFVLDGNLDSSQGPDVDFFRLTGVAGAALIVDLEGQSTNKGTLGDPYLGFFDSNCNLIALNDDSNNTLNSQLIITIPADGIFILGATHCCDGSFMGGGNGSYQLTVTPLQVIGSISGRITDAISGTPLRGDVEPFAFVRLLQCGDFGCFDVNSQATDSEGRFLFESDANGAPLRVGNYQIVASAIQHIESQSGQFAVGEGENYSVGDFSLASYPVVFSDAQPCVLPASGGTCEFSVKITNGLSTRLSGKAWSMVSGSSIGSPIDFTAFQADTRDVRLDSGRSTTLRFRFRLPASVAMGANVCALVYVGQNPNPFLSPAGLELIFCLVKGEGGFTLMSAQDARAAQIQTQMQQIDSPPLLPDKKK